MSLHQSSHEISGENLERAPELAPTPILQETEDFFVSNDTLGHTYLPTTNIIKGSVIVNGERITWDLEVPAEDLAYDGLGHFIGGYGAIKQTSRPPSHALAEEGVATLWARPARGSFLDWWEATKDPQKLHADAQQAIAYDLRTDNTRRKLEQIPNGTEINVDKKILLAHSMGGLAATGYAELEPGAVDMIIKLMATGYGSPTLWLLAKHFGPGLYGSVQHELKPAMQSGLIEPSWQNFKAALHYYLRARAIYEGRSCLRVDIRERDGDLRDMGIEVDYIAAKHDILVPPRKDVPQYVDQYRLIPNAGHLAPQAKPDLIAGVVVDMINNRKAA